MMIALMSAIVFFIGCGAGIAFCLSVDRPRWYLRMVIIALLFACAAVIVIAPFHFGGWPAPGEPPDGAYILGYMINEPRSILVWVAEPAPSNFPLVFCIIVPGQPERTVRTYALPYTKDTHEKIQKGEGKMLLQWRKGRGIEFVDPRLIMPKEGEI